MAQAHFEASTQNPRGSVRQPHIFAGAISERRRAACPEEFLDGEGIMMSVIDEGVFPPLNAGAATGFEIEAEEGTDHPIEAIPRHPELWGILLAGGDGSRMQDLWKRCLTWLLLPFPRWW